MIAQKSEKPDRSSRAFQNEVIRQCSTNPLTSQAIQTAIAGKTPDAGGEIRTDCPACDGGQSGTLGVNAGTGAFHCFRCGQKGNYLKKNGSEKQPMAEWLYNQADTVKNHPYIERKQIKPNNIRIDQHGNWVLPYTDKAGNLQTVQFIKPDGSKLFLSKAKNSGTGFKGASYVIEGSTDKVYVCEGPATGHSIHKATGATVFCAGGKENFKHVLPWLKSKHQAVIVCADNDRSGAGLKSAQQAAQENGLLITYPPTPGQDFNDLVVAGGLDAVRIALENAQGPEAELGKPPEQRKAGFRLMHIDEMKPISPDWLIYRRFERNTIGVLIGDYGTGKSFIAFDLGLCVASGKDFHGMPVKQGAVIFIVGEGHNGIYRRFQAWSIKNGINLKGLQIFVSTMPTGICDDDQVGRIIEAIEETKQKPAMVVVDTLQRNFGDGDENQTKDMARFVAGLDRIRAQYECTMLVVHHTGHADKQRGRGSIVMPGSTDAEYRVDKDPSDESLLRITCTKMKDHEKGEPTALRFESVNLPMVDEEGNTVTSAVLVDTEYVPPPVKGKLNRGKWQTTAIEKLKKLYQDQRQNLEKGCYDPSGAKATVEDWRHACYDAGMSRQSFNNAKNSLEQNYQITFDGHYVFFTENEW